MTISFKTLKLQEENIGVSSLALVLAKISSTPKLWATKGKLSRWDYIKLKSFCRAKNDKQNEKATYSLEKYLQTTYPIRSKYPE